ncbi:hypothetical protein MC885_001426 [Smutsia gigantea]|nr:hypothetical protein MC885_001426 [Smutsia gigantea]
MPEIRFRHVVSCNSQDSTHCAENLLKADTYRKWRAAKAGEKTISVVLQLEKEEQIHSVHIGNDGSAFVEVLVGSSAGGTGEQDYEVLLVTSSFMSPSESRSGSNPNRVRIFGPDKLVRAAAEKRWDRVKIVCSQPYSKDAPYGLSFVRFHSPPDKEEAEASPQKVTKLGQFRVKEEDEATAASRALGSISKVRASDPVPAPARGAVPGKPREEDTEPRGSRAGPQELGKILQGVVVVLSGFQNPFRSELRDKALELGAKYRPDWTADSTHLISHLLMLSILPPASCAFANTPKYSQVLGLGGRIVCKEWVLDCHRMRRRLPSRRYLMAGPGSSSEDEGGSHNGSSGDEAPKPPRKVWSPLPHGGGWRQDNGAEDSGDTEDELRRVAEQREQRQAPGQGENGDDPYAGSTDENTDNEGPPESPSLPVPELPDFFQGKHFFLYGEFPGEERRRLSRYVTAFSGELEDYMSDRVQFVITAQEWDPSFEEALMDNPSLVFVRPRWIYSCNEKQKLLPHQLYGVVPQA